MFRLPLLTSFCAFAALAQAPHPVPGGFSLPNGWRITPIGKAIDTEDLILNLSGSLDGRVVIEQHGGFNPHGLTVIDTASEQAVQRIPLKSSWLGMAWSHDGSKFYVSGGNGAHAPHVTVAPIYCFDYVKGRLNTTPSEWREALPANETYWSGLAMHPKKNLLYAANRGADPKRGHITIFNTDTGQPAGVIPVDVSPYQLKFSADGSMLYVSNWGSANVAFIDTALGKVVATVQTGENPNDLALGVDGRLYVSNGNENTVTVIDTAKRRAIETIHVGPTMHAPPGSTPNALALDANSNMLFVANADNNCIAVVNVKERGESQIMGFLPSGWYPSALHLTSQMKLYVGNSKGLEPHANPDGPTSPLLHGVPSKTSVRDIQRGTVNIVPLQNLKTRLKEWTRLVYENIPYKDDYLTAARAPKEPSIVPPQVGAGSPIRHVIYIIKENRTYDQVFGDIPRGNGDPRLTIFGENVTPNQHALANQWVLLDNLYCDGEVSVDGHSWSNSAIATDYNEKMWPASYGGHSMETKSNAYIPSGGHLWDLASRKGLTYRSYGEYASRASDGTTMDAAPGVGGLLGHVSPKFKLPGMRDTDNVKVFFEELDGFENNFTSLDPSKRLPNLVIMSLPEDHTAGTRPGGLTPRAMVANGDYAVGLLVDRMTKSKYWPDTAIFIIEDDAQNGPDHVDARRTTGMVISPFTKRNFVDSTLYTTSAMLRTMELLLGLPPMTQYDAAALPMYNSFNTTANLAPFTAIKPRIDVSEKNTLTSWGAKQSMEMDLDEVDQAPMFALNEILWKSVKGSDSEMPPPVHRYWFQKRDR